MLEVNGSGFRTLRNLIITRGDESSDGVGGGIDFSGTGDLLLNGVIVSFNRAGNGGGINFKGSGGLAILTLEHDVVISNNTAIGAAGVFNTAGFGGGIHVEGTARLVMLGDSIAVTGNEAAGAPQAPPLTGLRGGNGGGVEVLGPARSDIGSPGLGNTGVICANTARNGGGIAVTGADSSDDLDAQVRLVTTIATRPVRVHGNRASQQGGGIYVNPDFGIDNVLNATFCAFDFRIDDNRAPEGSAIDADTDSGEASAATWEAAST